MTETQRIDAIIEAVALEFHLTVETLNGPDCGRAAKIMPARFTLATALRRLGRLSYPAIGKIMGRHHASIINCVNGGSTWEDGAMDYRGTPNWMPAKLRAVQARLDNWIPPARLPFAPVGCEMYGDCLEFD